MAPRAPVLPAPSDASRYLCHKSAHHLRSRTATCTELKRKRDRSRHSLKRKFASDVMDQPLKLLCELGG